MFFNFRPFARHPFFFLGSYPLSVLANLFLHASLENHLKSLILSSLIQSKPLSTSQPREDWHKVNAQNGVTSRDSSANSFVLLRPHIWFKNLQWLYHFPYSHAILVITFSSGMLPTQFTWYFCPFLFNLRHRGKSCFTTHVTYTACWRPSCLYSTRVYIYKQTNQHRNANTQRYTHTEL